MDLDFDFEEGIESKDQKKAESLKADGYTSAEGALNRGAKTVCRHYLRGLCMKGDKCDYLHQFDPNRMPECMTFQKFGKCLDPMCLFKHVAASERQECARYRLGFCKLGPLCRCSHERLPRDKMPDVLPDWFLMPLLKNSHLVPRSEDVKLNSFEFRRNDVPMGGESIPGLPHAANGKCRYFVMRSVNLRNVQISACKGIWATGSGNTSRLCQAFREVDHVILIFTSGESRTFLGYARMVDEPDDRLFPGIWGEFSNRLGRSFKVHWLKHCSVTVNSADHICNPQNDNQPVRKGKDGQELPASVGERLCRFLWQEEDEDILKGSELEFEPRVRYEYPEEKEPEVPNLALEDAKKDAESPTRDARPRPASVPLGTFHDPKRGRTAPVALGKALASGSSSLLAAMSEADEDARGRWREGPPDWRYPPHGHGFFHPPPYGAPYYPQPYGYPSYEGRPPGSWAGARPDAPPNEWQGAAHEERARSRSRKRRRR